MSMDNAAASALGSVNVFTSNERGFTPEELADRALSKIISVGTNSHPVIVEQAKAFREEIRSVLVFYMKEAIRCDRTTLTNKFNLHGFPELTVLFNQD